MDMLLNSVQIKALRHALKWSPTKMAAEVGVTASIISRWEAGLANPRHKNMERLNAVARENGIIVESLVNGHATPSPAVPAPVPPSPPHAHQHPQPAEAIGA